MIYIFIATLIIITLLLIMIFCLSTNTLKMMKKQQKDIEHLQYLSKKEMEIRDKEIVKRKLEIKKRDKEIEALKKMSAYIKKEENLMSVLKHLEDIVENNKTHKDRLVININYQEIMANMDNKQKENLENIIISITNQAKTIGAVVVTTGYVKMLETLNNLPNDLNKNLFARFEKLTKKSEHENGILLGKGMLLMINLKSAVIPSDEYISLDTLSNIKPKIKTNLKEGYDWAINQITLYT